MSSSTIRSLRQFSRRCGRSCRRPWSGRRWRSAIEGEPGHPQVLLARRVREASVQCDLPCRTDRPARGSRSGRSTPGCSGPAGWALGDGGFFRSPGRKRLAIEEFGGLAPHPAGGRVPASDLLVQQHPQHLGGISVLGPGRWQARPWGLAQVGQPHPAKDLVRGVRDWRGGGMGGHWPNPFQELVRAERSASRPRRPGRRRRPRRPDGRGWRAGRRRRTGPQGPVDVLLAEGGGEFRRAGHLGTNPGDAGGAGLDQPPVGVLTQIEERDPFRGAGFRLRPVGAPAVGTVWVVGVNEPRTTRR